MSSHDDCDKVEITNDIALLTNLFIRHFFLPLN